jgi:hypothetical protein
MRLDTLIRYLHIHYFEISLVGEKPIEPIMPGASSNENCAGTCAFTRDNINDRVANRPAPTQINIKITRGAD